jgi:UDP-N-acetylmuramoyl-tripeptide--D-alanyl-D-alanine ligase
MEFGIGATSHFRRLVRIAPPALGVVTRIGAAHLELFKSIHGVVQEKGELVRAVPGSGLIVLASDHDHVAALEAMARAPVVKVPGGGVELSRQIARIVCRHLGVPDDVVDESLRSFRNPKGRLNVLRFSGLTLIDDSYNANPLSMALGLDTLADIGADGRRRVAVLGYMAELGDESGRYHEEVATHARRCSDLLIGVGAAAKLYQPDLWYATSAECAEAIDRLLRFDDCVLVKGSFAAQMELVSDRIKAIGGSSQSLSRCAA